MAIIPRIKDRGDQQLFITLLGAAIALVADGDITQARALQILNGTDETGQPLHENPLTTEDQNQLQTIITYAIGLNTNARARYMAKVGHVMQLAALNGPDALTEAEAASILGLT